MLDITVKGLPLDMRDSDRLESLRREIVEIVLAADLVGVHDERDVACYFYPDLQSNVQKPIKFEFSGFDGGREKMSGAKLCLRIREVLPKYMGIEDARVVFSMNGNEVRL